MPSTSSTRAASAARKEILDTLKDDHKRVKKAYRDFQKLDIDEDKDSVEAIVEQVLEELTVHATLEEELLYPAARGAIADENLIDEAEVEHETVHALIDQLKSMGPDDEKYAARFTVLCEYVTHHVKEEEGEMFPQLERTRLDWQALAAEMRERRSELSGNGGDALDSESASDSNLSDDVAQGVAAKGGAASRSGAARRP